MKTGIALSLRNVLCLIAKAAYGAISIILVRIPVILSTRSATHCPPVPLYADHFSERSDACFFIISKNVSG